MSLFLWQKSERSDLERHGLMLHLALCINILKIVQKLKLNVKCFEFPLPNISLWLKKPPLEF